MTTTMQAWLPIDPKSEFSLANLPMGIISTKADPAPHAATAVDDLVLDLKVLMANPLVHKQFSFLDIANVDGYDGIFTQPTLNAFAALGRPIHRKFRAALQDLLSEKTSCPEAFKDNADLRQAALLPKSKVTMHLPMHIGDYTDFYAGYHHAFASGVIFRGADNALQPNYLHLPVAYHGRSSSIVVSGTPIHRPMGQIILDPTAKPFKPVVEPSRKLDMELELGCFIATPNSHGDAIRVDEAEGHVFGYVLLNDWSARDVQRWEYVPLGPFNGKNFASTISPWVVMADALEPFRCRGIENPRLKEDGAEVVEYLRERRKDGVFDVTLEVDLTTAGGDTTTVTRTSTKNLIWSFPQMIAHHTLGGCPLQPGDLLGSGTISGPRSGEQGSFLEMSEDGKKDVLLAGMDARRFLKDGDTITFRGFAGKDGARIGFGECVGRIYGPKTR